MTLETPGDPQCHHEWVYGDLIHPMDPPIRHKICKKCGRVEHEMEKREDRRSSFDGLYDRFHRGKT